MNNNNLTLNEKKILDLHYDKEFMECVSDMKGVCSDKNNRIHKIKEILKEKNIEYTEKDAELFESIISEIRSKDSTISDSELEKICGGREDIYEKAVEKLNNFSDELQRKKVIFRTLILGDLS